MQTLSWHRTKQPIVDQLVRAAESDVLIVTVAVPVQVAVAVNGHAKVDVYATFAPK